MSEEKKTELTGDEMQDAAGGRGWSLAAQKVEGKYSLETEEKKAAPGGGTSGGTPQVK